MAGLSASDFKLAIDLALLLAHGNVSQPLMIIICRMLPNFILEKSGSIN